MYIVKEMGGGGKLLCMVYHPIYLDKYISCQKYALPSFLISCVIMPKKTIKYPKNYSR